MKSKIVKRLVAASLVTAMAVSMVGCGSEDTTSNNTGSSAEESKSSEAAPEKSSEAAPEASSDVVEEVSPYTVITDADGNPIDLGGIEVIIRDWWSSGEVEEPENAFEEAQQEYRDWIQETYNFTIKELAISDWGSTPQDFADYAATGGDEYYVFTLRAGSEFVAAMNSGLMYDVSTLDCFDFSEAKWGSGVHELYGGKNGEIYAFRGIDAEPRGGVFFNKRLLEEAGVKPDDLYAWQESGEWTWDKFEEVLAQVQRDVDNDGVIDIYGMTQQRSGFYEFSVYSNGGHFIDKVDGQYVNALESNETLEALNWAVEVANQYDLPQPEGSNWDYFLAEFVNGNAVFFCDQVYRAGQDLANMEDDFGFVCFPKGPQKDDYTNCYSDNPYVIPACYDADKAWKIAFAYNLYTEPIPGYEDADTWKSSYYGQFRDTDSVDLTIARLVKNGMVTYHGLIGSLNLGSDILWNLGTANNAEGVVETPAQAAEGLRNTWQAYLDEANK